MAINIDLKQFLPASLRTTRWGELIEATQSVLSSLKEEKIDVLLSKYNIDEMTEEQFQDFILYFGFDLSMFDGYTSSLEYLKRQILTLIYRIKYKSSRKAFLNEYYIFNMQGDVLPLYIKTDDSLEPFTDWWSNDENAVVINILDSGDDRVLYYMAYQFDVNFAWDSGRVFDDGIIVYDSNYETPFVAAFLDSPELVRGLDDESLLAYIQRRIILNYKHLKCETPLDFLTSYSAKAFSNDVVQLKRASEIEYYEPILDLYYKQDMSIIEVNYETFDDPYIYGQQRTKLLTTPFSSISYIELGNGRHTDFTSISGVASLTDTILIDHIVYTEVSATVKNVRRKLFAQGVSIQDFSEIGLYTSGSLGYGGNYCSGTLFMYSTIPTIRYNEKKHNNIQFNFIEV